MFESLKENHKAIVPRRMAVLGAVFGALALGFTSGGLLKGAKPFDWTMTIMELLFQVCFTAWLTVLAVKSDRP